jgi:Rieske Fe-S protein
LIFPKTWKMLESSCRQKGSPTEIKICRGEDHDLSRREFFKVTGGMAAGAGLASGGQAEAAPPVGQTAFPYHPKALGKARASREHSDHVPVSGRSLALQPHQAGRTVPGGVGPNRDIVAYSTMCTHMGCPLAYDATKRTPISRPCVKGQRYRPAESRVLHEAQIAATFFPAG